MKFSFLGQRSRRTPDLGINGSNQRRVFYARDAGLVTGWYLVQRCEEECYRAERYGRPLALLIVEPEPGSDKDAVRAQISDWLVAGTRMTDIAAYLGGTRFAILLPETTRTSAGKLAARLRASVRNARTGVAAYPQDGQSFGELVVAAKRALGESPEPVRERLEA